MRLDELNNKLRDIEYHYLDVVQSKTSYYSDLVERKVLTDYEMLLSVQIYNNEDLILEHEEWLSNFQFNPLFGFGALNIEYENFTGFKTSKPFCWLAHQIINHYGLDLNYILGVTSIWCDLILAEQKTF